ncbi:hypothetical protein [Marinobacter sp.]
MCEKKTQEVPHQESSSDPSGAKFEPDLVESLGTGGEGAGE